MPSADLSRLTAIVHASGSARGVDRLVASFRRHYPAVRLLAADDSRQPRELVGAEMVKLPKDVGASAARNALLARVRTPYFLLLEPTIEITRRTRIETLLAPAADNRFDVVAGDLVTCRKKWLVLTSRTVSAGHATFEFEGDALRLSTAPRPAVDGVEACDATHNFFVGRTDKVRMMGGWDPQLMVDERIEFFVRARRFGLRVGRNPHVVADCWAVAADGETRRGRDFRSLAVSKMGVARMIDVDGYAHEASAPVRESKAA